MRGSIWHLQAVRLFCVSIVLAFRALAQAQGGGAELTDKQKAMAAQAKAYFEQSNTVAALPLYEQLAKELPASPLFAERLAFCLLARAENMPPGDEKTAVVKRAKSEAERAKSLGDNSNLLATMLDHLAQNPSFEVSPLGEKMKQAEAAFSKGDLDGALALYEQVAAEDAKSYEARLFAGDMYFRKHDVKHAGEWFQKAIDVDPNQETAYRYWGDALMGVGETDAALNKYIDAVVAAPYERRAVMGLTQWAQKTGATIGRPNIQLPKAPEMQTSADGKTSTSITVDANLLDTHPGSGAAWLMYSMNRTLWRNERFKKEFPDAKQYRHTFAEERDSLTAALDVVKEQKIPEDKLDPSLKLLAQINGDGMLDPLILINLADREIARDYPAYRDAHRALIRAYIAKYIVHPKLQAN